MVRILSDGDHHPLHLTFILVCSKCSKCNKKQRQPYDDIIQLSLSAIAALSLVCLSWFVRKYSLLTFVNSFCNVTLLNMFYLKSSNLQHPSSSTKESSSGAEKGEKRNQTPFSLSLSLI
ncbi:hypothetical protein NMG60_11029681 [Bertholletia excelsa]